jgi:energy-coupling factor transporter ATP-binding protein EcfA2
MSVVWLGGPVGAGKSTLARSLRALVHPVASVAVLDEDEVREALADAAAIPAADGLTNAARLSALARVLSRQGLVVIVACSNSEVGVLAWNRENLPGYREVYMRASAETIKHRSRRHRSLDSDGPQPAPQPVPVAPPLDATRLRVPIDRLPDPELTIDMDNPEPPELIAFRVGVLIPEFVVATAGAAGIDTRWLRRGA